MSQTAKGSLIEQVLNVGSGIITANLTWIFIVEPIYGFNEPFLAVLGINLIFTIVSIIRGFFWRRLFNWFERTKGWFREAA